MRFLFTIVYLLAFIGAFTQTCEDFNPKLFPTLPDLYPEKFPKKINCIDSLGKKQGWWIYYTIFTDSIYKSVDHEKGEYIPCYSYGKYLNNMKEGDWNYFYNLSRPEIGLHKKVNYE